MMPRCSSRFAFIYILVDSFSSIPAFDLILPFLVPCVHECQVGSEDRDSIAAQVCRSVSAAGGCQVPGLQLGFNVRQHMSRDLAMHLCLAPELFPLQAKPSRGIALMVWIRAVLVSHASYLLSIPNLVDVISGLYRCVSYSFCCDHVSESLNSMVDSRVEVFPRLLRLSGRLELMLSQVHHFSGQHASIARSCRL